MTKHKYSGCILRKPVAAYSYDFDYREVGKKSKEQSKELRDDHVAELIKKNNFVPITVEHGTIKVGQVICTYQKPNGEVWVDFEVDDNSSAGRQAATLLSEGWMNDLSWTHDWRDMTPLEVSVVWKGYRENTTIERNNSLPYKPPSAVENVSNVSEAPILIQASTAAMSANASTPAPVAQEQQYVSWKLR
jgi:hypothetical protein